MDANNNKLLPSVAIVVPNYNGQRHLQSCFESLQQLNYPPDKIEIICVDNNSSDGSVAFLKDKFPDVHCVEAETNLGFAKGCNLGVYQSQSDYVAFLNNDAKVDKNWLLALVEAVQQDKETVCAAAKMLDWAGQTIDFVEGHLNFYGFARQIARRTEIEAGDFAQPKPILIPCGGAMLVDRQVFLEVGGFDEDYFMFFEDVDLGWRLWVLGYKVVFAPKAITYHRGHATAKKVARSRINFLHERNALATIIKNYEQSNLDKILPVALFLAMHRTTDYLQNSNIAPDMLQPHHWRTLPDHKFKQKIAVGQLAPLMAAHDVIANMSSLMVKREAIQSKRKRSDEEIINLFGQPFWVYSVSAHLKVDYFLAQGKLAEIFHISEIFQTAGKQILVLSHVGLPMFGFPASPESLRVEAIGQGLEARGHKILYAMPESLIADYPVPNRLKKIAWHSKNVEEIILYSAPDIMIVCHWQILEFMRLGTYRPLVLDCDTINTTANGNIPLPAAQKKESLKNVDLFVYSLENKRQSLISWLKQEGLPIEAESIQIVPIKTPSSGPEGIEALDAFCRKPFMRPDKPEISHRPLLGLPARAWQILNKSGLAGLKENIRQYIAWRIKLMKRET